MYRMGKYCNCKAKLKPNHLVAAAGCADDGAAVAALPIQWVPKRGGPILEKYLQDQKKDHEDILNKILNEASSINKNIDSKIRNIAEILHAEIKQNQQEIKCVVENYDVKVSKLSMAELGALQKQISLLYSNRVDVILQFKREADALERERADGIRTVLRENFQLLILVGLKPPKELIHDFDGQMYSINQQLLSNSMAYTELEAKLRAELDENIVSARAMLNQLCLGLATTRRGRSAARWTQRKWTSKMRSSSAPSGRQERHSSDPLIAHVLSNVEDFDECVSQLVKLYKNALLNVYTGFFSKLTELHANLNTYKVYDMEPHLYDSGLQAIIDNVLKRLSSNINDELPATYNFLETTRNTVLNIQKSLNCLGESLRNTFTLLKDAGHLWDAHILRLASIQKLTNAAIEDLQTRNDALQIENEVSFNIALEQVRSCADKDKLEAQFEVANAMLVNIGQLYLKHCEAELDRLQQYMNYVPPLSNILLSEIDVFLDLYRRPVNLKSSSLSSHSAVQISPSLLISPIPRAIIQTELQEMSLYNWRNGFIESFERTISVIPEQLNRQCQQWIEQKAFILHSRYSLKMVSHSIRLERLKVARDKRLAELVSHEKRLNSHLNAIHEFVDNLPKEAVKDFTLDSAELYPINEWLDSIETEINKLTNDDDVPVDPEVKKLKFRSYALRLTKHRSLFESSVQNKWEEKKCLIVHRVQEGRISNVRFLSQISLLGERGQYAPAEALKASAALLKATELLDVSLNKNMEALNSCQSQIISTVDQRIATLQRSIGDVGKPVAKGKTKGKK